MQEFVFISEEYIIKKYTLHKTKTILFVLFCC